MKTIKSVHLPDSTYAELKAISELFGVSKAKFIRKAIEMYIKAAKEYLATESGAAEVLRNDDDSPKQ